MAGLSKRGGARKGAGRPYGSGKGNGLATHVVRISSEVSKEQCESIPELIQILNRWEEECEFCGDSPRYYYLKKCLEDIRALGF